MNKPLQWCPRCGKVVHTDDVHTCSPRVPVPPHAAGEERHRRVCTKCRRDADVCHCSFKYDEHADRCTRLVPLAASQPAGERIDLARAKEIAASLADLLDGALRGKRLAPATDKSAVAIRLLLKALESPAASQAVLEMPDFVQSYIAEARQDVRGATMYAGKPRMRAEALLWLADRLAELERRGAG